MSNRYNERNARGDLVYKVSVDLHLTDGTFRYYLAKNWRDARGYLGSQEFREIAERVHFVTLVNRDR
jgi:alpha-glucuronidase